MSEYTPEKVAELVAESRVKHCSDCDHFIGAMGTALTAVSAERDEATANHHRTVRMNNDLVDQKMNLSEESDRLHKAITEALAAAPKLGELRWRNVDRMIGILRAALDKEGNDDE